MAQSLSSLKSQQFSLHNALEISIIVNKHLYASITKLLRANIKIHAYQNRCQISTISEQNVWNVSTIVRFWYRKISIWKEKKLIKTASPVAPSRWLLQFDFIAIQQSFTLPFPKKNIASMASSIPAHIPSLHVGNSPSPQSPRFHRKNILNPNKRVLNCCVNNLHKYPSGLDAPQKNG